MLKIKITSSDYESHGEHLEFVTNPNIISAKLHFRATYEENVKVHGEFFKEYNGWKLAFIFLDELDENEKLLDEIAIYIENNIDEIFALPSLKLRMFFKDNEHPYAEDKFKIKYDDFSMPFLKIVGFYQKEPVILFLKRNNNWTWTFFKFAYYDLENIKFDKNYHLKRKKELGNKNYSEMIDYFSKSAELIAKRPVITSSFDLKPEDIITA